MAVDQSLMAERLSYAVLNAAGLAAPRAVHAQISFNGKLDGVYTVVEEVDDVFTEDRFRADAREGEGGLYKSAWVRSRDESYYREHHKDGEDEAAYLVEAALAVMAATSETVAEVVERYFDAESIVTVTAVNTVLGMSDDWRQRHNFLWYVRKEQAVNAYTRIKKKLVMIPWDYDRVNDDERNRQWPRTWDDVWEPGDERCAAGHQSVEERALQDLRSNQRPISELWYFEAIHSEFPGTSRRSTCTHTHTYAYAYTHTHAHAQTTSCCPSSASSSPRFSPWH
jgi:spore coat protein CotH